MVIFFFFFFLDFRQPMFAGKWKPCFLIAFLSTAAVANLPGIHTETCKGQIYLLLQQTTT